MVPMKTPLARTIRFFARRSAHTAPCFLSRWLPPAPLPSNVLEDGFRAKRARADTRACATHPFPELSWRREAVVSALGREERAVASLGQDLDKKIAAVAS